MKTKFKLNQKVFDYSYGWGKVSEIFKNTSFSVYYSKFRLYILYREDGSYYYKEGLDTKPVLATEEYTLKGFTQKEQIDYNQLVGKWGKFWDRDSDKDFLVSILHCYNHYDQYEFVTKDDKCYEFFEPLTEEQIKILNLE